MRGLHVFEDQRPLIMWRDFLILTLVGIIALAGWSLLSLSAHGPWGRNQDLSRLNRNRARQR